MATCVYYGAVLMVKGLKKFGKHTVFLKGISLALLWCGLIIRYIEKDLKIQLDPGHCITQGAPDQMWHLCKIYFFSTFPRMIHRRYISVNWAYFLIHYVKHTFAHNINYVSVERCKMKFDHALLSWGMLNDYFINMEQYMCKFCIGR